MFRKLFRAVGLASDGSAFVIDLHKGRAELVKGNVPANFLSDLNGLIADKSIDRGMIRGRKQQDHLRLVFSEEVPNDLHQRIRNLWGLYESRFVE